MKVFHLSHPFEDTEWLSLKGDKYAGALSFPIEEAASVTDADVVFWDGVMTPRTQAHIYSVLRALSDRQILVLLGEARTLLEGSPFVKLFESKSTRIAELCGWNILPEQILSVLEKCQLAQSEVKSV
jgi:Ni,Fe-hydrogenase III small subunit